MPMVKVSNGGSASAVYLGSGSGQGLTINITDKVPDWANATTANFIVQANNVFASPYSGSSKNIGPSISYNNTTGVLTCRMWMDGTFYATSISAYYVKLDS